MKILRNIVLGISLVLAINLLVGAAGKKPSSHGVNLKFDSMTGTNIQRIVGDSYSINCRIDNVGDSTFYPQNSTTHFIHIVTYELDSREYYEYWKNTYEPQPHCIIPDSCKLPTNGENILPPQSWDEYQEILKGSGRIAILLDCNASGVYRETNYADNTFFVGIDSNYRRDDSFLSQSVRQKLLHY